MSEHDPLSTEQRRERAYQRHRQAQLAPSACTLMLPVRASLYETVKSFSYEAKRTATMPYYIATLRTLLLWAEVNSGSSDDAILDGIEAELDRIHERKDAYADHGAE